MVPQLRSRHRLRVVLDGRGSGGPFVPVASASVLVVAAVFHCMQDFLQRVSEVREAGDDNARRVVNLLGKARPPPEVAASGGLLEVGADDDAHPDVNLLDRARPPHLFKVPGDVLEVRDRAAVATTGDQGLARVT